MIIHFNRILRLKIEVLYRIHVFSVKCQSSAILQRIVNTYQGGGSSIYFINLKLIRYFSLIKTSCCFHLFPEGGGCGIDPTLWISLKYRAWGTEFNKSERSLSYLLPVQIKNYRLKSSKILKFESVIQICTSRNS